MPIVNSLSFFLFIIMKRKQIVRRLQTAYRNGKIKRVRPYVPEHPIMLALKALSYLVKGTSILLKSVNDAYKQSKEEGDIHCNKLKESGVLQKQLEAGESLNKALVQYHDKLANSN